MPHAQINIGFTFSFRKFNGLTQQLRQRGRVMLHGCDVPNCQLR